MPNRFRLAILIMSIILISTVLLRCLLDGAEVAVQSKTLKIAGLIQKGDRAGLALELELSRRPHTIDYLLKYRPFLIDGFRVRVIRNGEGQCLLSLDLVDYLGLIKTRSGTLTLGFKYNRANNDLTYIVSSFGTFDMLLPN